MISGVRELVAKGCIIRISPMKANDRDAFPSARVPKLSQKEEQSLGKQAVDDRSYVTNENPQTQFPTDLI